MKRSFSALLMLLMVSAGTTPVFTQKTKAVEKPVEKPIEKSLGRGLKPVYIPEVHVTTFGSIESYSEGSGAWVRWQMAVENDNAGFNVYRVTKMGQELAGEFVPGSAFKIAGPQKAMFGEEYSIFDADGGPDVYYRIEAIGMQGGSLWSGMVQPVQVGRIEEVKEGGELRTLTLPKPGANIVADKPEPTSELKKEMRASLVEPDPERHWEVIAQPGVKIGAKATGIIRVTRAQLENAGFNVSADPANWQLYLEGVERPIIVGPNADYIEFLGKALDTNESDIRIYNLIVGSEPGKRIPNTYVRPPHGNVRFKAYDQTFVRKYRTTYVNAILNGETDNYWGSVITATGTNLSLPLSGIDTSTGTVNVRLFLQGYSNTVHNVEVRLNGSLISTLHSTHQQAYSLDMELPTSALINGNNILNVKSVTPATSDFSLVDRVELDFKRDFVAEGNRLDFYSDPYRNTFLSGFSSPDIRVFDVTLEDEPRLVSNLQVMETNGTFGPKIPAGRSRMYYATEASNFATPVSVTPNDPTLHAVETNGATLLIIAEPNLMDSAQAWANYRSGQGISTKVISVEEVFDEFSYGVTSSYGIEDFLDYAVNVWQTPPSYVLLIGDATYDPRNYLGLGYLNKLPTRMVNTLYTETGSDEALADFNNDGLAEVAIGRIAARDNASVQNALNKVIAWEGSLTANSLERGALFVFDDPVGYDFKLMSRRIMSVLPSNIPTIEVDRGTQTGQDIVNVFNEVDTENPANSGIYVANWTGHGTAQAWSAQAFFSTNHVPLLTNSSNPTLITALTCLNGYFISLNTDSFAEAVTKSPNGGAVAIWASTGLTTPDVQEIMATRFYTKLNEGTIPRLGDLIKDAKTQLGGGGDVRLSWALFGDPMLKVR